MGGEDVVEDDVEGSLEGERIREDSGRGEGTHENSLSIEPRIH